MPSQDETHPHRRIQWRWVQVLTFVTALSLSVSAEAISVFNGSFEHGLLGWNTYGDVSVQGSSFGIDPTDESGFALLTTIDADEPVVYGTPFSDTFALSGGELAALGYTGTDPVEYDTRLHAQYDYLRDYSLRPHTGSVVKQTVYADAGQYITFDYNFLTNSGNASIHGDLALVVINGTDVLAPLDNHLLNVSTAHLNDNPKLIPWDSGFQTFSYFAASSGYYTVGIGVFDTADSDLMSALAVDNFKVIDIPEPSSAGLLALGLLGLGAIRRRRSTRG